MNSTTIDIDQLADDIALCATRIDAATHQLLTHIRHFDEASGWAKQGAKSCAAWLSWRIGLGAVAAREKVRVARALGKLPLIDEALHKGELSYAKVRAITRVATAESEQLLLHMARGATGAQLDKVCARFRSLDKHDAERRSVRRRHRPGGTVAITLTLEADEAERVWQALRQCKLDLASDTVSEEAVSAENVSAEAPPSMADAAVMMAERMLASPPEAVRLAPERRQLLVHLREDHLAAGSDPSSRASAWVAELHDGTTLCGETLKRIGCDAGLVVAKLGKQGNVLDVGRRRRTVTPAMWRALLTRQRHCCFPGCTHAVFVEAHHVEHWLAADGSPGGATSVDNLLLLCHPHHVAVHESGFSVDFNEDGAPVFREPSGRVIEQLPAPPRLGGSAIDVIANQQRQTGVHIDAATSLPLWDGTPADIGAAVEALAMRSAATLAAVPHVASTRDCVES